MNAILIAFIFLVGLIAYLAYVARMSSGMISGGRIRFLLPNGELSMSNQITKQIGQNVTAVAVFTNPDGSVGKVVGVPAWKSDNTAVFDPNTAPATISADGLTVNGPVLGVGVANVTCDGQGDPTVGQDDVQLTAQVTGVAQEISGGAISLS